MFEFPVATVDVEEEVDAEEVCTDEVTFEVVEAEEFVVLTGKRRREVVTVGFSTDSEEEMVVHALVDEIEGASTTNKDEVTEEVEVGTETDEAEVKLATLTVVDDEGMTGATPRKFVLFALTTGITSELGAE